MISSNVVLTLDRLEKEIEYFGNQGEFAQRNLLVC